MSEPLILNKATLQQHKFVQYRDFAESWYAQIIEVTDTDFSILALNTFDEFTYPYLEENKHIFPAYPLDIRESIAESIAYHNKQVADAQLRRDSFMDNLTNGFLDLILG